MKADKRSDIYYFTGTGNSFAVAKELARRIDARLISIPSIMNNECIETNADVVGLIFPVYNATFGESGLPLIVRKFIKKFRDIGSKYVFAVCTHRGMPVTTLENLDKAIRTQGGKLAAGFSIKMSIPFSGFEKIKYLIFHSELKPDLLKDELLRQKLIAQCYKNLDKLEKCINERKMIKLETPNFFTQFLISVLLQLEKQPAKSRYRKLARIKLKSFDELMALSDKSFLVNNNCNSCRICLKVCPVNNIKIVEEKPVWLHHCENCFACFQWCPKNAINGKIVEYEKKYHHPDVKVTDLILKMV